jgi:hypothetical protein
VNADLRHGLDLYLASVSHPPATVDAYGSVLFDASEQLEACAAMLPDGRVELFAAAGYVSTELLRTIVRADEYDDFDEELPRHQADVMTRWTGDGAQWAVDVDRGTGLLTLSMFVPAFPGDTAEWANVLDAFTRSAASWSARLQREAPDVSPIPGAGLDDIDSSALLRC